MKLRGKVIFWLSLIVALLIFWFVIPAETKSAWLASLDGMVDEYAEAVDRVQQDDDDDLEQDDDELVAAGNMTVALDDEAEAYSGIETVVLSASHFFPEVKAQARVVDLRELLQFRSQHNQALAALNVAKVAEKSAAQELARLKKSVGSVAAKNINYAEANWRDAKAKLQGLQFQLQDVRDQARQSWGETVAGWVIESNSKQFERLLSRQDSLLLVTLPIDQPLPAEVSFIRIARDSDREDARKAYLVAPALIADHAIQGETYYFRTATGKLRSGMRLDAWIPKGNEPLSGVFIADEAIVWYAGQPWAYVELEDGLYQRRSLRDSMTAVGGVFVQTAINEGETLVLEGAQMLLSEEFRWQIHDEDDD